MIALKIVLLVLLLARFLQKLPMSFDSVSDINTESQVDHGNLQSGESSNIEEPSPLSDREGTFDYDTIPSAKAESIEPSERSPSPVKLRSMRSTKGIPPTRYGSVTSHKVSVPSKFGKWLSSISKKIDTIHDHIFDLHIPLFIFIYIHCSYCKYVERRTEVRI